MTDYTLIVTDTSPLITLATADELDLLLRLGVPVEIPDIVYLEATRGNHEDGKRLVHWVSKHKEQVRIAPTERSAEWQTLIENKFRPKGYGELAAIEVISRHLKDDPDNHPILLYEDSDLNKFALRNNKIEIITTGTFLLELEHAREIQSLDRILDAAAEAGRKLPQQRNPERNSDLAAALLRIHSQNPD